MMKTTKKLLRKRHSFDCGDLIAIKSCAMMVYDPTSNVDDDCPTWVWMSGNALAIYVSAGPQIDTCIIILDGKLFVCNRFYVTGVG